MIHGASRPWVVVTAARGRPVHSARRGAPHWRCSVVGLRPLSRHRSFKAGLCAGASESRHVDGRRAPPETFRIACVSASSLLLFAGPVAFVRSPVPRRMHSGLPMWSRAGRGCRARMGSRALAFELGGGVPRALPGPAWRRSRPRSGAIWRRTLVRRCRSGSRPRGPRLHVAPLALVSTCWRALDRSGGASMLISLRTSAGDRSQSPGPLPLATPARPRRRPAPPPLCRRWKQRLLSSARSWRGSIAMSCTTWRRGRPTSIRGGTQSMCSGDRCRCLGLFSLAGIIINNGIVLIDKMDTERAKGGDPHAAVVTAALWVVPISGRRRSSRLAKPTRTSTVAFERSAVGQMRSTTPS